MRLFRLALPVPVPPDGSAAHHLGGPPEGKAQVVMQNDGLELAAVGRPPARSLRSPVNPVRPILHARAAWLPATCQVRKHPPCTSGTARDRPPALARDRRRLTAPVVTSATQAKTSRAAAITSGQHDGTLSRPWPNTKCQELKEAPSALPVS
jgi:hypothetical protein